MKLLILFPSLESLQDSDPMPLIIVGAIIICWLIIIADRIYPFLRNPPEDPREGYYGVFAAVSLLIFIFGGRFIGMGMDLGEMEYIILFYTLMINFGLLVLLYIWGYVKFKKQKSTSPAG